jgi:hypothetical protein
MNLLRVPVTETVTASYLIPLRTTMTVTEARQPTIKAVGDVDSLGAQQSPQRRGRSRDRRRAGSASAASRRGRWLCLTA